MSNQTRSETFETFAVGQIVMISRGRRRAEVTNVDRETDTVVIVTSTGPQVIDARDLYRTVVRCDYDGWPTAGDIFCSQYCAKASAALDRILDDAQGDLS